jgi:NADPH:quinone reductase-like Zn-dependent oxidoreductase
MAQSGHHDRAERCPLSGVKRIFIDKVFRLAEAPQAHRHMEASANMGKIMLQVS